MLHQEQPNLSFENKDLPIPKFDTEDVTPEEGYRSFEECLKSLDKKDASVSDATITYVGIFNALPPETQETIRQSYTREMSETGKCDIGHLIRYSYNKSLQDKKDGITKPPTLPSGEIVWTRPKPTSSNFTATRH